MSQKIAIKIDGKNGVDPESAAEVMRAIFDLVKDLDRKSWAVDAPRTTWRLSAALLVNPLTIEATGEDMVHTSEPAPNFALALVEQLQAIDRGETPNRFDRDALKLVRELARQSSQNREVTIRGMNSQAERSITISAQFRKNVARLLRQPRRVTKEYGSIDGTLIALANDPLKNEGTAKIRDRTDRTELVCHADPETASRLRLHLNRTARVVLYGTIKSEDGVPVSIDVEDFAEIPDDSRLPNLEDIHAMKLRPPKGQSVEDYLDDLRGDE